MKKYPFRPPEQLLLPWSPQATITTTRAARMLDVSPDVVLRMIEAGELKAYRWSKRRGVNWRVHYDSVLAIVIKAHEEHGITPRFDQ